MGNELAQGIEVGRRVSFVRRWGDDGRTFATHIVPLSAAGEPDRGASVLATTARVDVAGKRVSAQKIFPPLSEKETCLLALSNGKAKKSKTAHACEDVRHAPAAFYFSEGAERWGESAMTRKWAAVELEAEFVGLAPSGCGQVEGTARMRGREARAQESSDRPCASGGRAREDADRGPLTERLAACKRAWAEQASCTGELRSWHKGPARWPAEPPRARGEPDAAQDEHAGRAEGDAVEEEAKYSGAPAPKRAKLEADGASSRGRAHETGSDASVLPSALTGPAPRGPQSPACPLKDPPVPVAAALEPHCASYPPPRPASAEASRGAALHNAYGCAIAQQQHDAGLGEGVLALAMRTDTPAALDWAHAPGPPMGGGADSASPRLEAAAALSAAVKDEPTMASSPPEPAALIAPELAVPGSGSSAGWQGSGGCWWQGAVCGTARLRGAPERGSDDLVGGGGGGGSDHLGAEGLGAWRRVPAPGHGPAPWRGQGEWHGAGRASASADDALPDAA